MGQWHGGKGGDRRKSLVSQEEEDLRWALISAPAEEKPAIRQKIKELEEARTQKDDT